MFCFRSRAGLLLLAAGLCGCAVPTVDISGKVTQEGKDVTGGSVVLSPLGSRDNPNPGNPGIAEVGPDGTFSLKLEAGTAGLPAKYAVRFNSPPVKMTSKSQAAVPYQGMVPAQQEVDIKLGVNVVNIELVPVQVKK